MDGFQRAQEVKKQVDAEIAAENARNEVIVANAVNAIVRSVPERMISGRTHAINIDYTAFDPVPRHLRNEARDRTMELLSKLGYLISCNLYTQFCVSCENKE